MTTYVTAGKLDQRVVVQSASRATDQYGRLAGKTWATTETVWASIEAMPPGEQMESGKVKQRTRYKIMMRKNATLTQASRLVFLGALAEVVSIVKPDLRGDMMVVEAVQVETD